MVAPLIASPGSVQVCARISPPVPVSSVYHIWVTKKCASWISLIRGRTPMMYAIMAKKSPWFTPSLLCNKCPDPSYMSRTTRVAQ